MTLAEFLPLQTFHFLLVFSRIGSAFLLLPGVGETFVMPRLRLSLALLVSLLLMPLLNLPPLPTQAGDFARLIAFEVLLGLFFGGMARVIMLSLDIAGNIAGQQVGLSNATLFNPTMAQQGALLGVFLSICGALVVMATNLHIMLLARLKESYVAFPVGGLFPAEDMALYMGKLVSESMHLAVQLSAPFLVVGLVFNIGVGLLSRLMPQMQAYFVAVSVQLALGFLVLMLVVSTMLRVFASRMDDLLANFPYF